MKIYRPELSEEHDILNIHRAAFGKDKGKVIAELVKDLLSDPTALPLLSLGAKEDDTLLGHILFTRVIINGSDIPASILAPLAVLPQAQAKGVGTRLIHEGLDRLTATGVKLVFVLGHPTYYPRTGFTPAGVHGFEAPYPIPEKYAGAWMVQALGSFDLDQVSGRIQCAEVLTRPEHWRE